MPSRDASNPRTLPDVLARLYAGWLLAISLLKTLVLMVFARQSRGLKRFEQNYREDRLLPLAAAEQQSLPAMSACIGCGRCDDALRGAGRPGPQGFAGLMQFMLSSSRSMPDFGAAAQSVQGLEDKWLQRMEVRCPSAIPFRKVVGFVRGYQARLDGQG